MPERGSRVGLRERVVREAARLMRERGPEAVTTRGVAEAAGVQAPAIYRLFGDKDGLLEAVAEHVMTEHVSAKQVEADAESSAGADPVDDLRAAWTAQVDFGLANPSVFRLLSEPGRVARSPAARAGRAVLEARVHRIAAAGRLRVDERRAVDLVQAAGIGTIQTLLASPADDRDPALGDAMLDAVLARVLLDDVPSAAGGAIATANAYRALVPELAALSDAERRLLTEWTDRAITALKP